MFFFSTRRRKKTREISHEERRKGNGENVQGNAGKTPRGVGFFLPIFFEASLNKNPTLVFILFFILL